MTNTATFDENVALNLLIFEQGFDRSQGHTMRSAQQLGSIPSHLRLVTRQILTFSIENRNWGGKNKKNQWRETYALFGETVTSTGEKLAAPSVVADILVARLQKRKITKH